MTRFHVSPNRSSDSSCRRAPAPEASRRTRRWRPGRHRQGRAPGLLVVGYQSLPRSIELPPDKFAQYLGEEGLDEIRTLVAEPARAEQDGARTVRAMREDAALEWRLDRRRTGTRCSVSRLELVAERNPYLAQAGDTLPFRLTYEGKPRAGCAGDCRERASAGQPPVGPDGQRRACRVHASRGGTWLVKAVHMIPARPGSEADWQSFWASSTFDLSASHVQPTSR